MAVTDLTSVAVIGTWLDATLQAAYPPVNSGLVSRVVITPLIPLRYSDFATNTAVMPQRQVVPLDDTGSISTSVIATDCPALAGIAGLQYVAAVLLYDSTGHQIAPYSITFVAPGGTGPVVLSAPQNSVAGPGVGVPIA
ncbi:MAG TPA: hypothetical protein VGG83_10795 [Trebonia sp.]|jgi:hypothetical protein